MFPQLSSAPSGPSHPFLGGEKEIEIEKDRQTGRDDENLPVAEV